MPRNLPVIASTCQPDRLSSTRPGVRQVGGPLALVRTGDLIRLDAEGRRLELLVEEDQLERRRSEHVRAPHAKGSERGYARLFVENVLQADKGCDFGFLRRRPD